MEKEILERVDQLVDFIQAKSPLVWEAFYRQQIMEGIVCVIFLILSILFLLFAFHVLKTKPKWALDDFEGNLGGGILTIVSGCAVLIATVAFLCVGLLQLLNPEYYAIISLKP